ncbi:hypothetical protein M0R45_001319 [Rubus argutus]|uniref:Uncharacterized protein n=1 Tax=Rubus argutus TaxID=59490 RepID=A0AAW1VKX8_RUBAR
MRFCNIRIATNICKSRDSGCGPMPAGPGSVNMANWSRVCWTLVGWAGSSGPGWLKGATGPVWVRLLGLGQLILGPGLLDLLIGLQGPVWANFILGLGLLDLLLGLQGPVAAKTALVAH